jgi:anti-anti-sigma regulatory factor
VALVLLSKDLNWEKIENLKQIVLESLTTKQTLVLDFSNLEYTDAGFLQFLSSVSKASQKNPGIIQYQGPLSKEFQNALMDSGFARTLILRAEDLQLQLEE